MTIDPLHRANLTILANFLEVSVPPPEFGMETFIRVANGGNVYLQNLNLEMYAECGTVACAAGHGPLAGVKPLEGEGWNDYVSRAFGASVFHIDSVWGWLFDSHWSFRDNTPKGAAARIRWYLEHDGVPENWFDQLDGLADLCYTTS